MLVKDIRPGHAAARSPVDLTNVNGTLFFAADDGTNGIELWKSDGTAAGTVLVKDINPGSDGSSPGNLTNVNGTLFFAADDGVERLRAVEERRHGRRHRPGQGHPPGADSFATPLPHERERDALLRGQRRHATGSELWKSDGTAAGTVLVKDINPGGIGSIPVNLTNVNGTLFFSADDGAHGEELWKSDGTAAGTVLVKDITRPAPSGSVSTADR